MPLISGEAASGPWKEFFRIQRVHPLPRRPESRVAVKSTWVSQHRKIPFAFLAELLQIGDEGADACHASVNINRINGRRYT